MVGKITEFSNLHQNETCLFLGFNFVTLKITLRNPQLAYNLTRTSRILKP